MTHVFALSNHKGGVGKTTTTVNLAAGLAYLHDQKVLLIDLDPQANLTQSLGIPNEDRNIYTALTGNGGLQTYSYHKNLDVIPLTLDLSGAEVELATEPGREYILRELLEDLRPRYDFILIDTPPSLSLLTINAFTAATHVLIPLQAEYLAVQGLTKLVEVIEKIKKRLNKQLSLGGLLITQYDQRKVLHREVSNMVRDHFGNRVFTSVIRSNIALPKLPRCSKIFFPTTPVATEQMITPSCAAR